MTIRVQHPPREPDPPAPPFWGTGQEPDPELLVEGAVVLRHTEPTEPVEWGVKPLRVHIESPCCLASGRVFRDVPTGLADPHAYDPLAFCWACGRVWRLHLIDDNDGGWTAQFTHVEPGPMVVISRRPDRTRPDARTARTRGRTS